MFPGRFARPVPFPTHALRWLLLAVLLVGCTRGNAATPTTSPASAASPTRAASPSIGGTPQTFVAPTGTERKVDAVLLEIIATYQRQGRAAAEQQARDTGVLDDDNIVRLTLILTDTNTGPVTDKIRAIGGNVTGISGDTIEIEVPLERWLTYLSGDGKHMMEDLAAFETVREIRVTPQFRPHEMLPPARELRQWLAATTSEGVRVIGADQWHAAGYFGQGLRIGIIDPGFMGYESLLGNELPPSDRVQFRSFAASSRDREPHGAAVAEIIADIAPDASLFLARIDTNTSVDRAMRWLVDEAKVQVISMSFGSYGYYRSDGSSPSARAVDYAYGKGVLCTVSAGNNGDSHYGGTFTDEDGDGYHDFAPGKNALAVTTYRSTANVELVVNWEAWTGPAIDLNLEVTDPSGKIVASSSNVQTTGGKSPVEWVDFDYPAGQQFLVRIKARGEVSEVPLHFNVRGGDPEISTPEGSVGTPGDAKFALAVAATHWNNDQLETYSSQGPLADGRIKPDVSAPTVVSTVSYDQEGIKFNGTSAAAPHVAGAAALFLTANPGTPPDGIVQFLWGQAKDLAPAGIDNRTGHGRIQLGPPPTSPAPPRTVPAPSTSAIPVPAPPSGTPSASALPPTVVAPRPTAAASPALPPSPTPTIVLPTPTRPAVVGTPGASFTDPLVAPGTGLPQSNEASYVDGQYRISPTGANRAAWATYGTVYANARVEATAHFVGAVPGAAGIVFWYASPQDYYLFAVSSDGFYQITHFQAGRWIALTPWRQEAVIVAGGPNRLSVETTGGTIAVGVNGTPLASVDEPGGGGGFVGLLATSFDQPGTVVGFSDVVVRAGP